MWWRVLISWHSDAVQVTSAHNYNGHYQYCQLLPSRNLHQVNIRDCSSFDFILNKICKQPTFQTSDHTQLILFSMEVHDLSFDMALNLAIAAGLHLIGVLLSATSVYFIGIWEIQTVLSKAVPKGSPCYGTVKCLNVWPPQGGGRLLSRS